MAALCDQITPRDGSNQILEFQQRLIGAFSLRVCLSHRRPHALALAFSATINARGKLCQLTATHVFRNNTTTASPLSIIVDRLAPSFPTHCATFLAYPRLPADYQVEMPATRNVSSTKSTRYSRANVRHEQVLYHVVILCPALAPLPVRYILHTGTDCASSRLKKRSL
jgi:hypothetical protein